MTSHRWWMASLLVVLLGYPLAALSATHVILIERMAFHRVQPSTLAVGDTIEWRNQDVVPHTATLASGAIDARMAPGEVVRTELTAAGRLEFVCLYHPDMKIVVEVK